MARVLITDPADAILRRLSAILLRMASPSSRSDDRLLYIHKSYAIVAGSPQRANVAKRGRKRRLKL